MDAVPLAVQLVSSVREMRRFLQSVSEAPEELRRLMNLLEQLELILEQVGRWVHEQRGNNWATKSDMVTSVLRAVKACESKLTSLEGIIGDSKMASTAPNRAVRALGSFKLVCRKNELEGIEQQVHDAMNLLSLTLMANLTFAHSDNMGQLQGQISTVNQNMNSISTELSLLRRNLVNVPQKTKPQKPDTTRDLDNEQWNSTTSGFTVSKEQSTIVQTYTSLLGKLLIQREYQTANITGNDLRSAQGTCLKSQMTWYFAPSFLARAFEYKSLGARGFIQRVIRTYPVIPGDHPIWRMCRVGNLKGIQTLLSSGQISPFSVDDDGRTLLHVATDHSRVELCECLFDLGVNGQQADLYGTQPYPHPLGWVNTMSYSRVIYPLTTLFKSRCADLDEENFLTCLFEFFYLDITLEALDRTINEWVTKANIDSFRTSPLSAAMRMLHKSEPEFSEACKEIIHRLLALEPDLHNYYVSAGGTLLGEILDIAESPFESGKVGEQWLGILEDFGHDIKEYLQVELLEQEEWNSIAILISQWTAEPDVAADGTPRRYIIFSEENPRVSWDWYIDSEGHAFEALYEFRNLGRFTHVPIQDYNRPGESFNWPYFYPQWQNLPFAITRRHNTEAMKSSLRIRIAILKNRHEHRWIKRANKLERAQGIKRGPKVPGAWID